MRKNRSFIQRIHLDNLFSRKTTGTSTHHVGTTFTAFAVIRSSVKNFNLSICPEPGNGGNVGSIPLRRGYYQNFSTDVKTAVFENSASQPNEWVDVLFLTEGRFDANPIADEVQSSVLQIGRASGEMDGYTREVIAYYKYNNGGLQYVRDTQRNSFNNGSTSTKTELFKCPSGFNGEILGMELNVIETPDFIGMSMGLYAVDDGATYTTNPGNENHVCHLLGPEAIAVGEYNVSPMVQALDGSLVTDTKGAIRGGCIIAENEVLVLESPFASGSVGELELRIMIRLYPVSEVDV